MLQIIFDSETIETKCVSSFDDVVIKTLYSDPKSGLKFDKARNTMIINYDTNNYNTNNNEDADLQNCEINKNIQEKIAEREYKFLNELCLEKKITNFWVTFLDGRIWHFVDGITDGNIKLNNKKSLSLLFNDNLKIIFADKEINLQDFKKICQNKLFNFELKLMFYAIIYTTKDNINIKLKLKVSEIKILQLRDKTLNLFRVKEINGINGNTKNNYEYFQKYPTNKKKVIDNILQLVKKHS
jgi:hypothetical protein